MKKNALVALVMGSHSDWETLSECAKTLKKLKISCHEQVVSAHRTPDLLYKFAEKAESDGIEVIIAGAGGAAHLPGMIAAKTIIPVIGVPIESRILKGIDSLLSIVQMPAGIPVGTVAIGRAGAINAALYAAAILANYHPSIKRELSKFRRQQTQRVLDNPDPRKRP